METKDEKMPSEKLEEENSDDAGRDFRYGYNCCKPSWLQCLNKASWYTFFIFWANFVQSVVTNGLVGVILSTLEKRFSLNSMQSSWIASVYDLSSVPFIIVTSYVGARCHRPFWTAIGQFTVMVGSILFAIPHFTTNQVFLGDNNATDEGLCLLNSTEPRPELGESGDSGLQLYLGVFITARILHGFGMTPLYTIAVTYLDDISTKEAFSLYVVIFYVGGVLGPAFSYALGGVLLMLFTDFYAVDVDGIGLSPGDPRWIGNWWLGFLIGAVLLLCGGLPIMGYPRDMPGAAQIRAEKKTEAHNAKQDDLHTGVDFGFKISQTPSYLKTVCANPTFFGIVIYTCCDLAIIAGFTAFGPKIVEVIMSMSPALAGVSFGLTTIPGGVGGLLLGGFLIKKFKMSCPAILKMCSAVSVLFLGCVFALFVSCPQYLFAGVNTPYLNDSSTSGFISKCNLNCSCEGLAFQPVCSHDNIQFYSPCHAGCDFFHSPDDSTEEYYNCSCIRNPDRDAGIPDATTDNCSTPACPTVSIFYICFFIAMTFMFICSGSLISVVVRCVPNTHRSIGIGVQSLIPRLIGGPLGPFLFGVVLDDACNLWDPEGACMWYDVPRLRLTLFLLIMGLKLVSVIGLLFGTVLYKAPQDEPEYEDVVVTATDENDTKNATDSAVTYDKDNSDTRIAENGISTISHGHIPELTTEDIEPPPYYPTFQENVLHNTEF